MQTITTIFALNREAQPFLHRLATKSRQPKRNQPTWTATLPTGQTVEVIISGVGPRAAREALVERLAQAEAPVRVIAAGFAGALSDALPVTALYQPLQVMDEAGNAYIPQPLLELVPVRGRLLTTNRLVGCAVEKLTLGRLHRAIAVDMESAALAQVCQENNIAFSCLRVISDARARTLEPVLTELLNDGRVDGRVSWMRLARLLIHQPRLLGQLVRLARDTRVASQRLAAALHHAITTTPTLASRPGLTRAA